MHTCPQSGHGREPDEDGVYVIARPLFPFFPGLPLLAPRAESGTGARCPGRARGGAAVVPRTAAVPSPNDVPETSPGGGCGRVLDTARPSSRGKAYLRGPAPDREFADSPPHDVIYGGRPRLGSDRAPGERGSRTTGSGLALTYSPVMRVEWTPRRAAMWEGRRPGRTRASTATVDRPRRAACRGRRPVSVSLRRGEGPARRRGWRGR